MTTCDGKLLEKVFFVFAKKNKNSNLGWETLGDALIEWNVTSELGGKRL